MSPGETETETRLEAVTEVHLGAETEVYERTGKKACVRAEMEACIKTETGSAGRLTRRGMYDEAGRRRSQGPGTPKDGGTSKRGRYAPRR